MERVHCFLYEPDLFLKLFQPYSAYQTQAPAKSAQGARPLRQLNERFNRAVSHEISKRVSKGNIRTTDLQEIIGGPRFQEATLKQVVPSA